MDPRCHLRKPVCGSSCSPQLLLSRGMEYILLFPAGLPMRGELALACLSGFPCQHMAASWLADMATSAFFSAEGAFHFIEPSTVWRGSESPGFGFKRYYE